MMATFLVLLSALVSFSASAKKVHPGLAWLAGFLVVPFSILFQEFVLPPQGGVASMWPIALAFGGLYGAVASGVGILAARLVFRRGANSG